VCTVPTECPSPSWISQDGARHSASGRRSGAAATTKCRMLVGYYPTCKGSTAEVWYGRNRDAAACVDDWRLSRPAGRGGISMNGRDQILPFQLYIWLAALARGIPPPSAAASVHVAFARRPDPPPALTQRPTPALSERVEDPISCPAVQLRADDGPHSRPPACSCPQPT
jgi:hypothetical protein